MSTLFLSAPDVRTQQGSGFYKTFSTILTRKVGPDYAIYSSLIGRINAGDKVVVFDRDSQRCAEGRIASYALTGKAGNGVQRFDVYIDDLMEVPYTNAPSVNRCGVAVI